MSKKNIPNNKNNRIEINQKSETNYYDVISLSYIFGLLVIDFLPLFKSIEILGPQYFYLSILNIIYGLYIYNNSSLISEKLISFCKSISVLKVYFLFIILCGVSVITTNNSSLWVVNFSRLLIILFTLLNLIVLFFNRLHLVHKIAFIVSISLFLQSFGQLYDFIKTYNTSSAIDALNNLKGNTGSINILASSLSIKIPFVLIGIIHYENWRKWFLFLILIMTVSIIFLTGSRATYLSLFFQTLAFIAIYFRVYLVNKKTILNISIVVVVLFFAFFASNHVFKKTSGNSRFESVSSRAQQVANLKDRSINLRFIYWQNALKIIKEKPIFGVGLGNWKTASIPYEKTVFNDRFISNNTHNDFLEITAETGVLNGIIFASIFFILGFINLKKIIKSKVKELDTIAFISFLALISYVIDSSFNFPLYRPTMQINFCLLFALTILNSPTYDNLTTSKYSNKYAILVISLSLLTTYLSFKVFKAYQLENNIRANFVTNNFSLKAGEIVSELPRFPNVFTSGEPFATYAGKYFLLEKNYIQAQKYLNIGHKINPSLGRTEYYKSNIAEETGKLDSAYIYSKKALESRPRTRDYYIRAVNAANTIKDTLAILDIHKIYIEYNNKPEVWINSSSALNNSKFSTKSLINFIDEGLKFFPDNIQLMERRELFENNSRKLNGNQFTKQAIQFFNEKNYTKALEALQNALKVDPNNPKIIKNIAICKTMIK